jgi:hypothetical protein
MIYYKLGYEALTGYASEAARQWAEFGQRRPVLRQASVVLLVVMTIFILLPAQYLSEAANKLGVTNI